MSRKSKSKNPVSPRSAERRESQSVEAITVAWMLAVMSTVLAEVALMAATWWIWANRDDVPEEALALAAVLWLATLVMGALTLLLTPIVWRMRREKPPAGIVAFALLVGAAPLVVALVQSL